MEEVETVETTEHQEQERTIEQKYAELSKYAEDLEARLNKERVSTTFFRKATAAGISDPDKLAKLVDLSGVTVDEDGNSQGVDDIITAFTSIVPKMKPSPIGGPNSSTERPEKTRQALLQEAASKARKSGSPEDMAAYTQLKRSLGQ